MVHAQGSIERFQKTQQLCKDLVHPTGLSWDDVEGKTVPE